jgi:hypothetical protein
MPLCGQYSSNIQALLDGSSGLWDGSVLRDQGEPVARLDGGQESIQSW